MKVWSLYLDVHILNYEGNLEDCCVLASLGALMCFQMPIVDVYDKNIILFDKIVSTKLMGCSMKVSFSKYFGNFYSKKKTGSPFLYIFNEYFFNIQILA